MFLETLARVKPGDDVHFEAPLIVCGQKHLAVIEAELAHAGISNASIILEPMARNTAAALAAACLVQSKSNPDALMLVLPADHVIAKPEVLRQACLSACGAAIAGKIVTFAIVPTAPETGYGYIKQGRHIGNGVHEVEAFKEKPDAVTAAQYVAEGCYSWNAGIFFFKASALLNELNKHAPEIVNATRLAVEEAVQTGQSILLDNQAFATAPSNSIDYAVMEPTTQAAVVSVDMGWNDVGSFTTIWELADKDTHGNAISGNAKLFETKNCLVRSDIIPIALIGCSDLMVIATPEGILVAPKDRAQDVRLAAQAFKRT